MSYGNHINYNTGQPCDCSLAINGGHYYRDGVAFVSMSPADILAAVRTLPGVEEQDSYRISGFAPIVDVPADGSYLVVPLSSTDKEEK